MGNTTSKRIFAFGFAISTIMVLLVTISLYPQIQPYARQNSTNAKISSYQHIITQYLSMLQNMTINQHDNDDGRYKNTRNMLNNECGNDNFTVECPSDNSTVARCTSSHAQHLYKYPSYNDNQLNNDQLYKKHVATVQSLKYLVVSHHGGTSIATVSYLRNILKIPASNIANICSGSYCEKNDNVLEKFKYYHEYFNETLSEKYQIINNKNVLQSCCWRKSFTYWRNITNILRIHAMIASAISDEDKLDVIICAFPSSQCAFLMPFAKIFIIRFMHRFNHHLWGKAHQKWGRVIHSMSHYCKNIILTASNAYDWYYTTHLLNIKTSAFYLWPNFARHFVDDFGIKFERNYSQNDYKNNNFLMQSITLTSAQSEKAKIKYAPCFPFFNVSYLVRTLRDDHDINLLYNRTDFNSLIYNKTALQLKVGGMVALPHSVHGAKWIEYYAVGVQLFVPTLRFWVELNQKCECIPHRTAGNKAHHPGQINNFKQFEKECCRSNPFEAIHQTQWLSLSDYFMNQHFLKYVIHYDDQHDLLHKIVEYNALNFAEKWKRKQQQMEEFTSAAKGFAPHLTNAIYEAHTHSESECNLEINNLVKCLIQKGGDY